MLSKKQWTISKIDYKGSYMLQTAASILSGFLLGIVLSSFFHFQKKSKVNNEIIALKSAIKNLHSRMDHFNSYFAAKYR